MGLCYAAFAVRDSSLMIYRGGKINEAEKQEYELLKYSPYRNYMEGEFTEEDHIAIQEVIEWLQSKSEGTNTDIEELIKKIAALGGSHQSEILTGNIVHFNTRKHTNEQIYYNVSVLEQAIRNKQKASFLYFDLDEKLNKVFRKDGEVYETEPIALVFNNDKRRLNDRDRHRRR